MNNATAFLFPAFAMKYRDFDRAGVAGFAAEAALLFQRAARVVSIDPKKFERPGDFHLENELQDDLQDHYVSYVDCCAVANLLEKRGKSRQYVAGYSMGLFAAIWHSGAVSFEDGLRLLRTACSAAHEGCEAGQYGMGVVVGLTPEEIGRIIADHGLGLEVADVCGPRVVISSGLRAEVGCLLQAAEETGSLQARFLPVTAPFHCSLLAPVQDPILRCLQEIEVRDPTCPIVSCTDQRLLRTAAEVRREAAANVCRPMHWLRTMRRLLELGVTVFVECGPSESLCNLARNLEGDFCAYHPRKFDGFFSRPVVAGPSAL